MPHARSPAGPRTDQTPTHVGIIMDGNGRWAKAQGFPGSKAIAAAWRRSAARSGPRSTTTCAT